MDTRAYRHHLALALDVPDAERAIALVKKTRAHVGTYKVGLQLFIAEGPSIVQRLRALGVDVFLDLKLHDIPNTVASAVREAARLGAAWLTVHALGGPAMLKAARGVLSEQTVIPGQPRLRLLAVTALTHHDAADLRAVSLPSPDLLVPQLTELAAGHYIDGVVCSAQEAPLARGLMGDGASIVCPGIRPAGAPHGDQTRVVTPGDAMRAGADMLVIGRPIRNAKDPSRAAEHVLGEIAVACMRG